MSMKVLLLDDDDRYLELLKMMLESGDIDVFASSQNFDLRHLIDIHQPDIVVMDVLMHEHNGVELAKQYRALPESQDLPIVFMSAWTGSGELKLPRNSSRIFKPFTHSELIQTIERALGGASAKARF